VVAQPGQPRLTDTHGFRDAVKRHVAASGGMAGHVVYKDPNLGCGRADGGKTQNPKP